MAYELPRFFFHLREFAKLQPLTERNCMNTYKTTKLRIRLRQLLPILLLLALGATAQAALPPFGSVIGNQATATYNDASGVLRTATSNLVETTIKQVAGVTLTPDVNSATSGAGALVLFGHSITNTGNGNDVFSLSATDATSGTNLDFVPGSIKFYGDANSDGIPDDLSNPITATTILASGASFNFLVGAIVDGTAPSGNVSILNVTAESNFDSLVFADATDIATVSNNAIIAITKSISPNAGPADGTTEYTVTLRYTNSGNLGAEDVIITDQLPSGMTYVAGSGLWSVTGPDALTDDSSDDDANNYEQGTAPRRIGYLSTANKITATLESVPISYTGEVTFKMTVNSGTTPGNLYNVANVTYDDGTGTVVGPTPSNTVPFAVAQSYGVSIADGVTIASAPQGSITSFSNTVTNLGNGFDTFNITLSPHATDPFPAGTSFILYRSDGATPLTDTNLDGIPDTGSLAAGGTYNVVVRASLPPSATNLTDTPPFREVVTARSVGDNTKFDTGTDNLTSILSNVVDLTNDAAKTLGGGAGTAGDVILTNFSVAPGTTTTFPLFITNGATSVTDQFNITVDPATLPTGWSVVFRNTSGSVVTQTSSLPANGQQEIIATINVPVTASPGQRDIDFYATSPVTGARDVICDAVVVSEVRSIQLAPNNTGQVVSGGPIVYSHTITNLGNVSEALTYSTIALTTTNSDSARFTSTIYLDDGDGIFNAADVAVNAIPNTVTLAKGTSRTLWVRVLSASGTPDGAVNTTTLIATTTNLSYTSTVPAIVSATDSTSVINGDIEIVKEQAIDTNLDGTPDGAYGTTAVSAAPGEGIRYRITITNTGGSGVTSVVFKDTTPPFTTQAAGSGDRSATGLASWSTDLGTTFETFGSSDSEPGDGGTGTITLNIGSLGGGSKVTVYFGVKIDE